MTTVDPVKRPDGLSPVGPFFSPQAMAADIADGYHRPRIGVLLVAPRRGFGRDAVHRPRHRRSRLYRLACRPSADPERPSGGRARQPVAGMARPSIPRLASRSSICCRPKNWPQLLRDEAVTGVMHFAALAYVGESVDEPLVYYQNNLAGTISLLRAMDEAGVKRLVFSSTCATYGMPPKLPIIESTPQQPINPYGWSKRFVEQVLIDKAVARPRLCLRGAALFQRGRLCRGRQPWRGPSSRNAPDSAGAAGGPGSAQVDYRVWH